MAGRGVLHGLSRGDRGGVDRREREAEEPRWAEPLPDGQHRKYVRVSDSRGMPLVKKRVCFGTFPQEERWFLMSRISSRSASVNSLGGPLPNNSVKLKLSTAQCITESSVLA